MKKTILLILLLVAVLITGCSSSEEKEAKEACKERLKENYARYKDDTIVSCVADYNKDKKEVVYTYCINSNGDLYEGYSTKYEKGSKYYETFLRSYNQIKDEVKGNDDYYAFEFSANELK